VILADFPAPTLHFSAEDEELRNRLRAWLSDNGAVSAPADYAQRIQTLVRWQQSLCAAGFVGLSWPTQFGGGGRGVTAEAVFAEELASSGMPELINRIGVYMVGPTFMDMGTDEQRQRFLPGMLDATELWCQGFSEPGAGSDLAAVTTSARRDGEKMIVNGQKLWTSRANVARWCALLVRADPAQERHRGLALLAVDMRTPGITVRPMPQLLNEPHFSEVFFDDVEVPRGNIIGGDSGGWAVAMQMLSYERGLFVLERLIRLQRRLDELRDLVPDTRAHTTAASRIARVHVHLEVLKAQVYRTLAAQNAGTLRPGATSVDKVLFSDVYQELFEASVELLGPETARTENSWTHDLLESRSVSIYGGTTEVQLGIVARRPLALGASR
jgi:alkylation response protein AidB-like acyl-CoA dehydrogenase